MHKPRSSRYYGLSLGRMHWTVLNLSDVNTATVHVIYDDDDYDYDYNDDNDDGNDDDVINRT